MKKINLKRVIIYVLFLLINCNFTFNVFSQNVAVTDDDLYTAEGSAMLDINSTTKGLLIPRLTSVQRSTIISAATGLLVFDTDKNAFYYYNGVEWLALPQVSISTGVSDALFAVKNSVGDTIFAVYNDGVKVVVPYGTKGKVGGFAVSGRSPTKAGEEEYLLVTPDSTRIFVNEVDVKGSVGGFAVSGRSPTKTSTYNYFLTNADSTRVYIDTISTKGSVGGFAVSGRSPTKAGTVKFMDMTPKNYFIGQEAGKSITTGSYNSYIGYQAGKSTQSGSKNIFIGYQSGYNIIGGTGNLGSYNVYLGYQAGYSDTSGWGNTGIGYMSLYSNITGFNNVANGYQSLYSNTEGYYDVANGYKALFSNISGASNVANGYQAMYSNTTGSSNVAIGLNALYANKTGSVNIAIGPYAITNNTDGSQNVAIGSQAMFTATGSGNTAVGWNSFSSGIGFSNSTALGAGTIINASNQVRIGNTDVTSFYCKGAYAATTTTVPNVYVNSSGQIMRSTTAIPDGSGFANKMAFWSDANTLSYNSNLQWDNTNARLGIGATAPSRPLDVSGTDEPAARFRRSTNGSLLEFVFGPTIVGDISITETTTSYNAFTGSHYAKVPDGILKGHLVGLNGNNTYLNNNPESEIIYGTQVSNEINSPNILGAYLGMSDFNGTNSPGLVMAVGNGVMWVVDNGENLEIGDYLISSSISGHAMKDKGEFEIAYIIARVAESVNWNIENMIIDGVKHKLISVFFENFKIDRSNYKMSFELEKLKTDYLELKKEIELIKNK